VPYFGGITKTLMDVLLGFQVFTFGSVPLKTYLPDGDIDLTAFSEHQNLKDTWAKEVCSVLESEERNEYAEFHVKEVHYIQAEVYFLLSLSF
jgi:DNA polymerase sigma